jgi:hypothetical protein
MNGVVEPPRATAAEFTMGLAGDADRQMPNAWTEWQTTCRIVGLAVGRKMPEKP